MGGGSFRACCRYELVCDQAFAFARKHNAWCYPIVEQALMHGKIGAQFLLSILFCKTSGFSRTKTGLGDHVKTRSPRSTDLFDDIRPAVAISPRDRKKTRFRRSSTSIAASTLQTTLSLQQTTAPVSILKRGAVSSTERTMASSQYFSRGMWDFQKCNCPNIKHPIGNPCIFLDAGWFFVRI